MFRCLMISVFVPAFNEEARLPLTVATILRAAEQAGGLPLEILVVNDGSTDRTQAVIADLERVHPQVKSIHFKSNRGLGQGLSAALEMASGERLAMITGDNVVHA